MCWTGQLLNKLEANATYLVSTYFAIWFPIKVKQCGPRKRCEVITEKPKTPYSQCHPQALLWQDKVLVQEAS